MTLGDDFDFRVGESYTHCVVVTGRHHNTPVDLSNGGKTYSSATAGTTEGTARVIFTVFTAGTTPEVLLTKDTGDPPILAADISLSVNPLASTVTTPCAICINLTQDDAATLIPGSYTYEVRVVLKDVQKVVYPLTDNTASFTINGSETWDATAEPPAPRVAQQERIDLERKRLSDQLWCVSVKNDSDSESRRRERRKL